MSNYGRNFEFRVVPTPWQRHGRFALAPAAGSIPMGTAVVATGDFNELDLAEVTPVTVAGPPVQGQMGIAIYEYGPAAYAGFDAQITTYSDFGDIPRGAAVQVIHGENVKVVLRNTEDRTFLSTRDYEGRVMVAGLGADPTLAEGDLLEPNPTGNPDDGFWRATVTPANAWLVVTKVEADRGAVEAQMLF